MALHSLYCADVLLRNYSLTRVMSDTVVDAVCRFSMYLYDGEMRLFWP